MVRLAVARALIANADSLVADSTLGLQLQDVVTAASQSASVARIVLEQRLRVETRGLKAAIAEQEPAPSRVVVVPRRDSRLPGRVSPRLEHAAKQRWLSDGKRLAKEDDVRVATAFKRLLRLPGASIVDVCFAADGSS